ncbi:hypothetical protein MASE_15460 [Alteromonas macleodii ATCC 27126]|nr:hypothetical protein MASE_15460 [Alteromonas macleodii ATCC 27126]
MINTWPAPTCAGLFFFTYSFTCWQGKSSHSYGRYFDSDFSTNVEAAIVKLALSVAIIVASYQRRSLSKPK